MSDDATPTFAQDILYILASESNDTGLAAAQARELTGAILQEMRARIAALYRHGPPASAEALIEALDLRRPIHDESHHEWEARHPTSPLNVFIAANRKLRDEILERDVLIGQLRRANARLLGLGKNDESDDEREGR